MKPCIEETPTNQYFNETRYHRENGSMYYRNAATRKRMHVEVWEHYYGPVPHGCHIHHIDGDPTNNDISNLQCLTARDHMKLHASMVDYSKQCEAMSRARQKAPEWHRSEEGREWHREHYLAIQAKLQRRKEFTCSICGDDFFAVDNGNNKYCSIECRNKARRVKRKQAKEKTEKIAKTA